MEVLLCYPMDPIREESSSLASLFCDHSDFGFLDATKTSRCQWCASLALNVKRRPKSEPLAPLRGLLSQCAASQEHVVQPLDSCILGESEGSVCFTHIFAG
jgi:hypothetical protein